jgi:hypothetical protein
MLLRDIGRALLDEIDHRDVAAGMRQTARRRLAHPLPATETRPRISHRGPLISLVKSLAVEWASKDIRVNAIAPGHIVTPRLYDTNERVAYYAESPIPMKRRGQPVEIAKAATFLVSDLASYVSGVTLPVDGGLLAANLINAGHVFQRPPR